MFQLSGFYCKGSLSGDLKGFQGVIRDYDIPTSMLLRAIFGGVRQGLTGLRFVVQGFWLRV